MSRYGARSAEAQPAGWSPKWKVPKGPLECRFLGCPKAATWWVQAPYARGTPWCGDHKEGWVKANSLAADANMAAEARPLADLRKLRINGGDHA